MSIRYLDLSGAVNFWTNIKNFILSKIPTKTSELTNDSGFLTQHQSLSNYVTLNSEQTITGKKLFTNSTTKVNSVNTFTGSTQFIDLSTTVPRGQFPESAYRVGRVYIGDNTSYNGAWFIIDPTIDTNKAYYRMVTTSPDNTDSTRFSITWDSTKEGARRRRLACMGDLICATNNTYQIGESGNAWQDAYINKIHGISDYTNLKTNSFNVNTTLTHGGSGRRVILAMGAITLTVPAPEEGSWFLIKAVNGQVTLNLASNVTVTGITAGVFSGPIYLQPNESILLCYYSSTTYNATMSTIRRSGIAGRNGNVPAENPKHWFKIAENYVTATYRDPFICLRVFESTTGNTIGTLCAHCRINNTVGVVDTSNCYLQWQDAGSSNDLSKYALTTNETSGTGVTITLWCMLTGGWSSLKFEVVTEYGAVDQLGNPEWVLTRRRQADGDLAELLDTDFTKIVYSTLTTLKNDTTGKAANVTGTVAIANGGTGATTRLNAVKNLTNESVGTPTHFLTITTNWGKAGYTTIAQAKTVLGITGDMGAHSDSEYVHKTGDESITGTKTFGNGTLIVDNGTGNNAHGEIKLNGTRPVYINADNSEDGLFANTACGMSIILNDSSKSIHIGGYSTNSSGRKFIKTTDKAPYLTLGTQEVGTQILVPENDTADSTFSITSTLKYASGAAAKSFTVKFKQGDDGSSGVFPVANNKTDLGLSSNRWKNVYATNYYYGADAVEFSDKFVTTDTTQTITGTKTFSSTITGDISGNASTATEFSANKDVTLTGDVTGTASSKAGWSVSTTLSNSGVTAGTYGPSEDVTGNNNATISVPEITVDSKGRVTSVTNRTLTCKNNTYNVYNKTLTIQKNGTNVATFTSNSNTNVTANITVPTKTSELTNDSNFLTTSSSLNASKLTGTIDIARLPQGALERVITVANQTARFALTTSSVQLGDTVKQLDTGVMYVVVNESKLNSNDGYLEYTAGSASSVPWSGITSKPTEFTPSSHTHTKSEITDFPTNVSAFTNDSGYLTSHQSLANYVTLNTAQEITNAKTFKDATTARKLTSVEAGNVIPSSDKLISDIWQDKNGKELGRIYYSKTKGGNTALIMRAGDWFSESEGVYSLNASGTNRRAELHLYTDSSGNCCIKPVGYFSATLKPLSSSVWLGESTNPFGRIYANAFEFCNASLLPDTDVQTTEEHSIGFYGQNNTPLSYITFQKRPNLKDRIAIRINTSSSAYKSYCFDASCLYPESSNSVDIGSTTNIFKNIYCNNYYKGTTAFGDIVTHNASEFLTSHQSLANYVTTNTSQSISGIKTFPTNINLANTSSSQIETWNIKFSKTDTNGTGASQLGVYQLANSSDYVACLRLGNPRGDNKPTTGTGVNTGNCWSGIGVYYNYVLNRGYPYAPNCNSWSDSSNADAELASTAWVRRYCETTKNFVTNSSLSSASVASASEFSANKSVTLTGDVTGTVSSKAGWTVATTLANSGVTAGTYGPSADVTGSNNATILVPEITVDAKGRVTAVTNRTYTSVNTDNDKRVHQYYKTDDNVYRLLWCYDAGNTSTSTLSSKYTAMNNAFYVNPSTGSLYATKLYSGGVEVLTSHQSLDNYVTLDSNQTITAIKTITGGNQGKMIFKNPNFTLGTTPESTTTVTRIYFGGGASYDGSTGVITNDITSDGYSQLEICALNNNSSSSYRASLILRYEQDQTRPRFIKSWGDFCPYSDDTYYLGRSDSAWKECYCNAYYLGTTAFGDIVTHNASEFLTSHQSLSSCVKNVVTNNQTIKSTGITRGTAPSSAQTFGIGFSDNNNKYISNIYGQYATDKSTYVGLYAYKGTTTSNGDNASVRVGYDASGNAYTYAPTPATTDNSTQIATTAFVKAQGYLTSHQSLANYVTTNTDQSISGIKSHSKHISILGDYVGNESSTNGRSCLYLKANRDTDGKSGLYVTKYRQNVAQGSMGSSNVVFLSHDILENETRTNAVFVESYSNWANDVPGGMSIYSSIATRNLGTSAKPWTNAYITNLNLNGNAFNPASVSGNIGDIIFGTCLCVDVSGSGALGITVSGGSLYASYIYNGNVVSAYGTPSIVSLTGTWVYLGAGFKSGVGQDKLTGIWKRIA